MTESAPRRRARTELGRAVRAGRERRRLTIAEIAQEGGCAEDTWTKVERGEVVRPSSYGKIAAALRVPPDLVIAAAKSTKDLPHLLDAIVAASDDPSGGPVLPAPERLTDGQLLYALKAITEELIRRQRDHAANLRGLKADIWTDRRTDKLLRRGGAANTPPAASLDAAHRTGEEKPYGMG